MLKLSVMPNKTEAESDVPPIDMAFHYSEDEVYGRIKAYGASGRARYMIGKTFDVAYPVIYIRRVMLENIGIVTMLINYPVVLASVATLTAWATSIKGRFAYLVFHMTILLAVRKFVMNVSSR